MGSYKLFGNKEVTVTRINQCYVGSMEFILNGTAKSGVYVALLTILYIYSGIYVVQVIFK